MFCVSGLVSYTTDTLYNEDGNGDGAENVKVCVSSSEADFDAVRLVFVRSVRGANTVRYDGACTVSFKANGFVGIVDACGVGRGSFAQNGRRVERSADMDTGALGGTGSLMCADSSTRRFRNLWSSFVSLDKFIPESTFSAHLLKSATSLFNRRNSASRFLRDLCFSSTAAETLSCVKSQSMYVSPSASD